jgi:enamine deaminase RidA (YjgF/YER057c/UK114 family)
MPAPRFLVPAGVGEQMRDNYHYSQGVQVGDMIYVTGQGGWDEAFDISADVHEQVRRAFANIANVLAEAGASWPNVIDITSYHVELDDSVLGTMVEELRSHCPNHQPLWTVIGVASLALPAMKVEITANAVAAS